MPDARDDFTAAAQAIADERYSGNFARGFAHLSFQPSFPTFEFTDDTAEEVTSVDRRGDLGADGLFIDDDEQQILLFQAKSGTTLKDAKLHEQISTFVSCPTKLLSDDWVSKAHSEMKSLANDFRDAIRNGYEIIYAFATNSRISSTVRSTFSDLAEAPGTSTQATISLLDASDLGDHYGKLLLSLYGKPTTVDFAVQKAQMHEPPSAERVVYLTLPAHEYVKACKPYGMELFRYNPRLYLGVNRVNAGIAQTLKNDLQRHWFHLLNNGITAVCERFDAIDAGDQVVLHVED